MATSADGSSSSQTFAIAVNDVDEWDEGGISDLSTAANFVTENAAVGTVIGFTIEASDADATNNAVTYSLVSNPGGLFAINATTGVVTVAGAIDREVVGGVTGFGVIATSDDGSTIVQAFSVTVGNVAGVTITGNASANIININTTVAGQQRATNEEDTINGAGGNDTINAAGGNDTVLGGLGNDTLIGGAGDDLLRGGAGVDRLTGNVGLDRFDFDLIADIGKAVGARDIVIDFAKGQDKIDLSTIDANSVLAGNQAFVFVTAERTTFTGVRGQLIWDKQDATGTANDRTLVMGDINGDKVADFALELKGLHNLAAADFLL
jgi:serralysin